MSDSLLDGRDTYNRLDPQGLLGRIAALPEQIEEAWAAGRAIALPPDYASPERVAVLGMGGSGIGGALLQALAGDLRARVPVLALRGYRVPAFVDGRTLVLASSNSGNTEETLAALEQALQAGAKCVAITTGGRLLEIARRRGLPALTFRWDGEPRSALGWSFVSLLAICARGGVVADVDAELREAAASMRELGATIARDVPEASNPAKQLARRLSGRLPMFVGAEALAPVAYRWRTQVNENAKSWAIADELPEMNHNAQAGYGLPRRIVPLLHAVFLRHASMHPRILLRIDATLDEMKRAGVTAEVLDVEGPHVLAQVLRAIHFGDYVSYYLGLLNGVDPAPVPTLEALKQRLAATPV